MNEADAPPISGTLIRINNVAVNLSEKVIYTYMGVLHPKWAMPPTAVPAIEPPLNDHFIKHSIGTRIFLGGGIAMW